jgi:hypothetical protein
MCILCIHHSFVELEKWFDMRHAHRVTDALGHPGQSESAALVMGHVGPDQSSNASGIDVGNFSEV